MPGARHRAWHRAPRCSCGGPDILQSKVEIHRKEKRVITAFSAIPFNINKVFSNMTHISSLSCQISTMVFESWVCGYLLLNLKMP